MTGPDRKTHKTGIARRLIIYVVLFSSFITLFVTAIQLYRDYDDDIELIEDQLQQIRDVHLKTLTSALWASDKKELRTHLEGIFNRRDMQFLEVRDQDKVWVSVGTPQTRDVISRQYTMIYPHRGRDIEIGLLTVTASLTGVYQRLLKKVWVILVSNAIQIFLVAGFILIIFHTLIARHLSRIANFTHNLDINSLDKPLVLDREDTPQRKVDELGLVVSAINQMQENIKQSFAALKQSEAHFHVLAKAAPVGIFSADAQGRCVYVNERWCELAGMSQTEALGEGWAQALHPDDRQRVFTEWQQSALDKVPFHSEYRYQRPDAKVTWLLGSAEAECDSSGQVVGYVGTVTDITERRRAEQVLARSKAEFEAMFNAISDGVAFADTERRIVMCNPAVYEMFGYSDQELIGRTTEMLYADRKDFLEQGRRRYRTEPVKQQGAPYEVRYKRKDGTVFWTETIGTQVKDVNAKTIGFIALFRDITERKRAEEREISLGRILDGSLNEVYIFNAETFRFIQVNRVAMENLGYSAEELQKLTPLDLKPYMTHRTFVKLLTPLRNGTKEKVRFNTTHQRKDGSLYPVEVQVQLSTFGSVLAFAAIILDITERLQSEEALRRSQKMEAVGQLAGGIAHDFNNQLGVIIGYLDYLKTYVANSEGPRQWVDTASKATLRCMDLTRQLLTFTRRQSNKKTVVDINASFKTLEAMIDRSVTPAIDVQYHLSDKLWLTEIDPGEFQDATLNLVINARDAMPGGGKLLIETSNKTLDADSILLSPDAQVGDYVQLMLSDTGMGMDKETLEHIFEPFFTTKPEGKGTGLGMAMVYGFVKRYGGYIKVYSELGVGTTMRLYLPRSAALKSTTATVEEVELPTGSEAILIVDDEVDLLELANQYLSSLGYRTRTAVDGVQALAILAEDEQFDLLFTDVVMPGGMDGYELAQQATQQRPKLRVLLTSGFTSKAISHNGLDRFSTHFLGKPYRKGDLAQRVRLVLDEEWGHAGKLLDTADTKEGLAGRTILIVDDEEDVRDLFKLNLEGLGCKTVQAGNADEAITLYRRSMQGDDPIDLIILDITLPGGLGGKEIADKIHTMDPYVRIIVASGHTQAPEMTHFRDHGFSGALEKDFNREKIKQVLEQVLGIG
ncbi:MAG: PAS domain S-box protein [Gammaproteobacteria bacterium]|nr:PAS domain S-box protein [Gammaproteobacteria bacterium]